MNIDDGSFWIYEYDALGQLVSGKRYWNDWTPVAGQQYEYAFDDIGNRTSTKAGGDAFGADLRAAGYTANGLNQYTSRDVPGYLNVFGIAHPNAGVTVNGASPYRRGEYFWKELAVNNTNAAQWQAVTNIASLGSTNQTNTGNLFLPKTAEAYTYDADGNLTSDGRWTNRWDGENRLSEMTSHAGGPGGSRKSLQFGYDSGSRRYSKVVSNWTGSAWTKVLHEAFAYDGWNLLAAIDATNMTVIRSFLWGLDLSGSQQGAGGVGGLIAFRQHSGSQAGTHFAAFDGNGNVMGLVDGGGNLSARYEYDPFGQTVRASGSAAALNPVRFSSKVVDEQTDLAYYGYRYLNTSTGRWLSRDPIEEKGGPNVYCGVRNAPAGGVDPRGTDLLQNEIDGTITGYVSIPGCKISGIAVGGGTPCFVLWNCAETKIKDGDPILGEPLQVMSQVLNAYWDNTAGKCMARVLRWYETPVWQPYMVYTGALITQRYQCQACTSLPVKLGRLIEQTVVRQSAVNRVVEEEQDRSDHKTTFEAIPGITDEPHCEALTGAMNLL